ncbi:MAG: amino acid permease [Gammaproteobacteria bacterium]
MTNRDTPRLNRSLSLPLVSLYGLGNILGAGIYVLIGKVSGEAGYLAPYAFLLASAVAAISAFSYAELASRYPLSAGEAVYVQKGLNIKQLSLVVGLLIIATGIVSAATIARGFVGYLQVFVDLPAWVTIITLLTLLGVIAIWGITQSVATAAVFTLLEVGGLLLILWIAYPALEEFPRRAQEAAQGSGRMGWIGLVSGAYLAFYAYVGFEDIVNVAEEVKRPRRVLPMAILIALGGATLFYCLVAVSALAVLSPDELGSSDAPLAAVYQQVTGANPWIISIISMIAVVNGALIQIIMASRVGYGLARQGWLPQVLASVHPATRTPMLATVLITIMIIIAALWLPITTLANATTTLLLLIFSLVNLSLIRVKLRIGAGSDVFNVPLLVPVLGMITTLLFLAAQATAIVLGTA